MRDYFQSDTEREHDRLEGRRSKTDAKAALDRRMIRETSGFTDALKRWRSNREKLSAYRAGLWTPKKRYDVDWGKVGYTTMLQLTNALIAAGCIFTGSWPVAILSIPAFIGLNIYFLTKDSRI